MKRLSTCLFFLFSYAASAQQVTFTTYTVQDGLVANPIRCIYQDGKGFIWIGTFEGLSRYDGYKFTNYTTANGLSHNFINSIIEVDDKLLIAQNNGAIDVIKNYSIRKGWMIPSAVNFSISHIDRLLMSTDENGFYEYKNDSLVLASGEKYPYALGAILPVGDSLLLIAGVDNHFFIYKKELSTVLTSLFTSSHNYALFEDSKKRIWACTSGGLIHLTVQSGKVPAISVAPLPSQFNFEPLKSEQVTSMTEEKDGSFWIGTLKGLVHLFPDGRYHVYNEKDGLPSATIYTLYRDKENNLWIGTALGLAKWAAKNSVISFKTQSGDFRNDVTEITSPGDQKIILRTDHGIQDFNLNTLDFKNIHVFDYRFPFPFTGTSPMLIHSRNQIGMLDVKKNIVIPFEKLDTLITGATAAVKHPKGGLFLGTFGGLFAIHKNSVKKILPYRITTIAADTSENIWVGTWLDGLFRITINKNDRGSYVVRDMTPMVKTKQIRGTFVDRNQNIWIGTRYSGAFCLTPLSKNNYDVEHFNRTSGLMSDWVISFAETKTGDIWVGTYLGLDKLVKEPAGYRTFNFSKAANFFAEIKKIISINDHWICVANTGIAIFKDENLHQSVPLKPIIFSSSLGLPDDKLTFDLPVNKISLRPNQNAARFEFGALGFINERQILYSYRLKGSGDTTWSKPENIHEASYASLSPGNYAFEVKTIGWNGQEGVPAVFSFSIRTPFWKQWWFVALCMMVVAGFFYALYRYRINQLLRLQTVRNSIATDLHDDIGSSLTNISILSELSSKNLLQPEKAQPFLQRISEEVQASSQAMDDIIWSVNSRNDSLQETMARMRRYAAELFDNIETNCHLKLDEHTGNKKLSMEQRRDVYLIYKEALNNIHKHAKANNVWVEVIQNHNFLLIQIKDDGKGFNTDSITHRNGIKNLSSRVEKWNGNIRIVSGVDQGTSIDIKIPLKG